MNVDYKSMLFIGTAVLGLGIGCGICVEGKRRKENLGAQQCDAAKNIERVAQNASGQADAAIVDVANALRIKQLLQRLAVIDRNKVGADQEIWSLKAEVQKILTSNRGGVKGIHGFLGETSQVHIANIKAFINGDEPLYMLLDDNSMTDYIRGLEIIQQKACQAGGHLGLDAIKRHMEKYPEFVEKGGIYQIPKDMYAQYKKLRDLPTDAAMKLRRKDLQLWKYIHVFTEKNPEIVVEPMEVSYTDIQAGNIENTIKSVEKNTDREFEKQRETAQAEHAPNVEEFLKVCGISAAIEGGISAGSEFIKKIQSGRKLSDFTGQDFKDIGAKLLLGSGKGAFRGGITYVATNIIRIPAAIASGAVTAVYGICREGFLLCKKRISKKQFVKRSIFNVVETAASTAGAFIGKNLCKKHPIIGSIVGSIIGSAFTAPVRKLAFA